MRFVNRYVAPVGEKRKAKGLKTKCTKRRRVTGNDSDDTSSDKTYVPSQVECSDSDENSAGEGGNVKESLTALLGSQSSSSSSENEDDNDLEKGDHLDVVEISSDEDIEKKMAVPLPKGTKMICHRCPTERKGSFKDRKAYLDHIKRHIFGSIFRCPDCRKTFTNMTKCLMHETLRHGVINNPNNDPFVTKAEEYLRKRQEEQNQDQENGGVSGFGSDSPIGDEEEADAMASILPVSELLRKSTTTSMYRGPKLDDEVDYLASYEIQISNTLKQNPKGHAANAVAGVAIYSHLKAVEKGYAKNRLGRFMDLNKKGSAALQKSLKAAMEEEEDKREKKRSKKQENN